jgi:hypothetical protein
MSAAEEGAFTRPGDWAETHFSGERRIGQVVEVPRSFPGGDYLLRLFIQRPGAGLQGVETILIARHATEFITIGKTRPKPQLVAAGRKEDASCRS